MLVRRSERERERDDINIRRKTLDSGLKWTQPGEKLTSDADTMERGVGIVTARAPRMVRLCLSYASNPITRRSNFAERVIRGNQI